MNNLTVINKNGQLVVSSRQIARDFEKENFNIVRDIENLLKTEPLKIEGLKYFIPSTFIHKGNEYKEYLLTRNGFSLLVMGFNGAKALRWKIKYIKAFNKMEKTLLRILARQENAQWQELRKTGKVTRLYETDTIKTFVDYAINQGSQNANRYYTNISKMENKALFLLEQKFPNVRDLLTGQQMLTVGAADQVIEKALRDGMIAELPYKDIYVKAKKNIETFATIMGLSKVPDDDLQNLLGGNYNEINR